ncbi:N-acetyltransferase [Marinihelvus fidelis]|uniref:N-acetyltransferase n=1 Tax=Marinihelvus fidelis TaxID=2613842 RepID=A0A5N0T664_9GAMM|nr:N-acetyltransferase [Marinihelvus fidelis]KAA9129637.1 N-acetyltransferase [Marinihelvus fidelis]
MIRAEQPGDEDAIRSITDQAFATAVHSSGTESKIVDALRQAGALTVSLVAVADHASESQLFGHIALSPVSLSDGTDGWYGLGPVSVLPAQQRNGVGSALVRAALQNLRETGAAGCVLLGDPDYYGRFGFRPIDSLVLPGVPAEYFQAIRFSATVPTATVSYHVAFDM